MSNKAIFSKVFGGKYVFGDKLGEGATANVFKFHLEAEGRTPSGERPIYACKQISRTYLTNCPPKKSESRWNSLVREYTIMELVDSPHVIKVYEFIPTKNNFYMIQEYANGGSLQGLLDLKGRFPELTARKVLR